MTPDEFRKQLAEWKEETEEHIPDFVLDYVEELEKKLGEKKTVFTVRAIYQHDMDVEHRIVYQGADTKKAFKNCYDEIKDCIDDYRDDYHYPLPDANDHFKTPDEYYDTTYTGLEIKKLFIDWINDAIKNKKNITFNFAYDGGDFDSENESDNGGFELDVTEV